MKKNQLTRALRVSKLEIAALEAALRCYKDAQSAAENIPLFSMLCTKEEVLYRRATILAKKAAAMSDNTAPISIEPCLDVCGGGSLPDVNLNGNSNVLAQLENRNSSDLSRRLLQTIISSGCRPLSNAELAIITNLAESEIRNARTQLERGGKILILKSGYITAEPLEQRRLEIHETLKQCHRDHPIDPGMPLGELRGKIFSDCPEACDELIEYFVGKGVFRSANGVAWLSGFRPKYSSAQDNMRKAIEALYEDSGLDPLEDKLTIENFPAKRELYRQIAAAMCRDKQLIALNPQFAVHPKFYAKALDLAEGIYSEKGTITLGDFRDAIGIPRRRALLYLEYWDTQGITRRIGDQRIFFAPSKCD